MDSLTEREAIGRFLALYTMLATIERKCRRVETVAVMAYSGVIAVNVSLPAVAGFDWPDLISYAFACYFALALRRWVLRAIERRRLWSHWQTTAAHARARLAFLDGLDRSRPDQVGAPVA